MIVVRTAQRAASVSQLASPIGWVEVRPQELNKQEARDRLCFFNSGGKLPVRTASESGYQKTHLRAAIRPTYGCHVSGTLTD